jgi:hypothetical protein
VTAYSHDASSFEYVKEPAHNALQILIAVIALGLKPLVTLVIFLSVPPFVEWR